MGEGVAAAGTALLDAERDLWRTQVEDLGAALAALVAAGQGANADDEHDPEGATFAVEREQLGAQLAHARARLAEVDAALDRVAAGTYGVCAGCGSPIAPDRLAARPTATTCIACARTVRETRPTWP